MGKSCYSSEFLENISKDDITQTGLWCWNMMSILQHCYVLHPDTFKYSRRIYPTCCETSCFTLL